VPWHSVLSDLLAQFDENDVNDAKDRLLAAWAEGMVQRKARESAHLNANHAWAQMARELVNLGLDPDTFKETWDAVRDSLGDGSSSSPTAPAPAPVPAGPVITVNMTSALDHQLLHEYKHYAGRIAQIRADLHNIYYANGFWHSRAEGDKHFHWDGNGYRYYVDIEKGNGTRLRLRVIVNGPPAGPVTVTLGTIWDDKK
jgi:hypothetical protein